MGAIMEIEFNGWCGTPKADRLEVEMHRLCNDHAIADVLGQALCEMVAHKDKTPCGHEHPDTVSITRSGLIYKACPCGAVWRMMK